MQSIFDISKYLYASTRMLKMYMVTVRMRGRANAHRFNYKVLQVKCNLNFMEIVLSRFKWIIVNYKTTSTLPITHQDSNMKLL